MKKNMKEKNQVVPDEVLSKEFISRFKTEADVSKFLKQLHAQVLEKMLEGEMDAHLGYEKNSVAGNNSGNSRNGSYPKKIQTEHGEAVISVHIYCRRPAASTYRVCDILNSQVTDGLDFHIALKKAFQ